MNTKTFVLIFMLLSSALGAWAQKRIKAIDITIEQPEVGTPIWNGEAQAAIKVKSIITDAFGSQNMLGEEKIKADNVQQGKIYSIHRIVYCKRGKI